MDFSYGCLQVLKCESLTLKYSKRECRATRHTDLLQSDTSHRKLTTVTCKCEIILCALEKIFLPKRVGFECTFWTWFSMNSMHVYVRDFLGCCPPWFGVCHFQIIFHFVLKPGHPGNFWDLANPASHALVLQVYAILPRLFMWALWIELRCSYLHCRHFTNYFSSTQRRVSELERAWILWGSLCLVAKWLGWSFQFHCIPHCPDAQEQWRELKAKTPWRFLQTSDAQFWSSDGKLCSRSWEFHTQSHPSCVSVECGVRLLWQIESSLLLCRRRAQGCWWRGKSGKVRDWRSVDKPTPQSTTNPSLQIPLKPLQPWRKACFRGLSS